VEDGGFWFYLENSILGGVAKAFAAMMKENK